MRIRAAVLRQPGGPLAIEEIELDAPKAYEVLVRIAACGICASDLHVLHGDLPEPMPLVLGHEASGVVEKVGPGVGSLSPGDHVVLSIVCACGSCAACTSGRPHLCSVSGQMAGSGTLADGTSRMHSAGEVIHHFNSVSGFAERVVVPQSGAIRIPAEIDLETAALLSCALTTGVGAVLNTAAVPPGATVAVIGCGGVGLSVVQGARLAGAARIIAIDPRAASLELAGDLGATEIIEASASDVVEAVLERMPGGVDYVFEALGTPETIAAAWAMTASGGTTVVVGLPPKGSVVPIDTWGFICDKRILGCFMGSANPAVDIPRLAALAQSGELVIDALATNRVALSALPETMALAGKGRAARYLVIPD